MQAGRPWGRRMLWLLILWAAGVACVGCVALLLRFLMRLVGMA